MSVSYSNVNLFIDGAWTPAASGKTLPVLNPATEETIGTVAHAETADLDRALAAAHKGFQTWRKVSAYDRYKLMRRAADIIRGRADEIAHLMTLEQGKPFVEAKGETVLAGDLIDWFAEEGRRAYGRTVPPRIDGVFQLEMKEPVGPVAAFTPWNFPINQAVRKLSCAIAAGCSIIVKGPEETPASCAALIDAFAQAGIPAGVVNLVFGVPAEISAYLIPHPVIRKVSFTGSTAVGRTIATTAAERLVRSSLELGGKSPTVVFPQPVTDALADDVILAMRMTRQGQSCTAGSRLLVHADIHDELLARIAQQLSKLVIGDPLDEASDIGSLINERQATRVRDFVAEAQGLPGADIVCGGPEPVGSPDGLYFEPTVISGVQPDWRIVQEEVFGPVLVAVPWIDVDQAVELANATHYGLAAFVFAPRIDDALGVAHRIDAGWVQVNQGGGQGPGQSFGGFKDSGIGREASLEGMLEGFTQIKQINVRLG